MLNYRLFTTVLLITLTLSTIWSQFARGGEHAIADSSSTPYIRVSEATGMTRFLHLPTPFRSVNLTPRRNDARLDTTHLMNLATAYWHEQGRQFGIQDPAQELELISRTDDAIGMTHLTFQQHHQGIPAFGVQLRMHLNAKGEIETVNGIFIPDISLDSTPTIDADQAGRIARRIAYSRYAKLEKFNLANLEITGHKLYIYRTGLTQERPGSNHLAYGIDMTLSGQHRWKFFIDAHNGLLVDSLEMSHNVLDRLIYHDQEIAWREGDSLPYHGDKIAERGINDLIDYTEDTYNFFFTLSGGAFDAWNGKGTIMTAIYDGVASCPNAYWNASSAYFCPYVTSDDIVAHEWSHGYTQETHDLAYQWQPGALNEAYGDIWGETIDLLNGSGSDSPNALRSDNSCSIFGLGENRTDVTYRWLVGEDSTGFGNPLRDMWNPSCHGGPGKVSDSLYSCTSADSGGIHANATVPSHAFALLVDGGNYNGEHISGIGLTKAANIYWRAQNIYQTYTTDFSDHADALEQSCQDLVGEKLYEPNTDSPSPTIVQEQISLADCENLSLAIQSVELRLSNSCNFTTLLDPDPPVLCSANTEPVMLLEQGWESGSGEWSAGTYSVTLPATFDTPNWAVVEKLPDQREGSGAFVVDDRNLGDCDADDESGILYLQSPPISIPEDMADHSPLQIAFDHWFALESGWDGGNVKLRVNGGMWHLVPANAFTFNPYNRTLFVNFRDSLNTNPLAGQAAFTGVNPGSIDGSWGQSHINLQGLVALGDVVELRFELGLDGCNGVTGWYIDDVQMYQCQHVTPAPTNSTTATPTGTSTATPTETPTRAPTETSTSTAIVTSTSTPSEIPTETEISTSTQTPIKTVIYTETAIPTATSTVVVWTATSTPTINSEEIVTPTLNPIATPTFSPILTETSEPTQTAMPTETLAVTPIMTASITPTYTPSPTATDVPTEIPTVTPTATPTFTETATSTDSPTATAIPTVILGLTSTSTPIYTITITPTATISHTPSYVPKMTTTSTPTATVTHSVNPTTTLRTPVETTVSSLRINHPRGAPQSFFSIHGTNYTPEDQMDIRIDGEFLDDFQIDESGGFTIVLDTESVPIGTYSVTIEIARNLNVIGESVQEWGVTFELAPNAQRWEREDDVPILKVNDAILSWMLYLPLIDR